MNLQPRSHTMENYNTLVRRQIPIDLMAALDLNRSSSPYEEETALARRSSPRKLHKIDYSVFTSRAQADARVYEILHQMADDAATRDEIYSYLNEMATIARSGIASRKFRAAISAMGASLKPFANDMPPRIAAMIEDMIVA